MLTHIHPLHYRFTHSSTFNGGDQLIRLGVRDCATSMPAMCREPLCPIKVLPLTAERLASRQRELPLLHRSYWLMRQAKTLSPASLVTIPVSLRRLLSAPAGRWPFPTLSPQSLHGCLDPYPVVPFRCTYPFLPGKPRPRHRREKLGTLNEPCNATSTGDPISGVQSFANVQASMLARPPSCTHR